MNEYNPEHGTSQGGLSRASRSMQFALSRRSFLSSSLGMAAAVRLSQFGLAAGEARHRRIDVHHHYFPMSQSVNRDWTPAASLDAMEKYDIATAILSAVQYGDQIYDGTEKGTALARSYNDFAAKIVSDHPGRFGLLAVLPLRNQDASLREIEYAFDVLKSGRSWYSEQRGRQMAGRSAFHAGVRRAESTQGCRFHPPIRRKVLPKPGDRRQRRGHRIRLRYDSRGHESAL